MRILKKINGVDVTSYFTADGAEIKYKKIQGGRGGVMLSGRTEEDILALKLVLTETALPLTTTQLSTVLSLLTAGNNNITYYEISTDSDETIDVIWEETGSRSRGKGADGYERWTGLKLTFTEK